ncbi:MAG TPA: DUF433 domain-containing protein [Candidatus Fraserbacteria bacterium]|nr:DUF433 domain-containing protein [Candidatus Fraserbacteria bacterium]
MALKQNVTDVVACTPDMMSGTPVFRGTRVPVQTLIEHLEAGESLEVFLEDFPSVSREQAVQFLELVKDAVLAGVHEGPAR